MSGPNEKNPAEADGGYVHRPAGDASEESVAADAGPPGETDSAGTTPEPTGFGRAGWLLVIAVVGCFLVIPGIIYLNPTVPARAGLPFFATFLVLPLIPALGLGLLAVWSMQAAS